MPLHEDFRLKAERFGDRVAVEASGGRSITYDRLERLVSALSRHLLSQGLQPGDRVGFCLWKSIDSIAAILGILRAGGVYVPLDPAAPARRNAFILDDCQVAVALVGLSFREQLTEELSQLDCELSLLVLDQKEERPLASALAAAGSSDSHHTTEPSPPGANDDDLAYILYTSGSTGRPKGVAITHRSALGFLDWCDHTFSPGAKDRFSSHPPLHFDLSILDVHLPLRCGSTLVLIDEELGKEPVGLAELISERRLTVWYSAPSILSLMARYGDLESRDLSALRLVLFAGEVFPIKHLRALQRQLKGHDTGGPRYFNLYGPTETNVCTFHEVRERIPDDQTEDLPIGKPCAHFATRVSGPKGEAMPPGQQGELWVAGDSVMRGYWNLAEETEKAFVREGERCWYRTGDLVVEDDHGNYLFQGRSDRMIKKRGYRVELGEIESCLNAHRGVSEAGVVARADEDRGTLVTAFIGPAGPARPGIIELKAHCARSLPLYMVPDTFVFVDTLPRTGTGKVDYQRLQEQLEP